VLGSLRQHLRRGPAGYDPDRYWEARASELIATYDDPASWHLRSWNIAKSPEQELIPRLVAAHDITSVLVVGAGSGRQYAYLEPLGIDIRGFDLSPTLVRECTTRYPTITTVEDSVVGCDTRQSPADLVLSVTVLQHVPPADISAALESLRRLASKLLVVLEFTEFDSQHAYIFAHDYPALMGDWPLVERVLVAESDGERTECFVWRRPDVPSR
jgi:SAM-dependent methyltransferase